MGIVENTYAELKQQELKNNPYSCLHMADIDINPHQIEAFTFALSSLELGGAILADEVGLGKTIEAGLCLLNLLERNNTCLKNYLMPDMKARYLSLMVVQMILLLNRFIRRGKLETMESMWVVEMLN